VSNVQLPVQITTRRITGRNHMITIDYPVVKNMESPAAQHRINRSIITLVDSIMREQGYYKEQKLEMLGWYEIKNNQRGVLSLTADNYAFSYPSAHGMTIVKGLSFDTSNGNSYELADLFRPGADYVKVLTDIVAQQIKERQIELLDEFNSIRPDQDFYIADKSLVLFFQLYEITPYYMGLQYFPISVYQLQDIIREDGPLGVMAAGD